jgi:hypothetical protein
VVNQAAAVNWSAIVKRLFESIQHEAGVRCSA